MITNYTDPIVTLNQVYRASQTGEVPTLGAYIIGPNYNIYKYDTLTGDKLRLRLLNDASIFQEATASRRLFPVIGDYDGFILKDSIKVLVKNALIKVSELEEDTYKFTINPTDASNLKMGTDVIKILKKINSGDSTNPESITKAVDLLLMGIAEGDFIYINYIKALTDTDVTEVKAYISKIIKDATGASCYCILNTDLNDSYTIKKITALKTVSGYIMPSNISFYNSEDAESPITISDGLISTSLPFYIQIKLNPTMDVELLGIEEISGGYSIVEGLCYVEYKALSTKWQNMIGSVASFNYILELLGLISPLNPLAIAVAGALSESNGSYVYFTSIPVASLANVLDTITEYKKAIGLSLNNDMQYGIVPCTSDKNILKSLMGYILDKAALAVPVLKYLYGNIEISKLTESEVLDLERGALVISSYDSDNKKVIFKNLPFFYRSKIRRGDILLLTKSLYSERYIIENVSNGNALTLEKAVDNTKLPAGEGTKAVIKHVLKLTSEIVDNLIKNKPFVSSRGSVIFADTAIFHNMLVPTYVAAAAIAGKRSSSEPHAPLSNLALQLLTTADMTGFTKDNLDKLGAYGFWRIGLNTDGLTISRRQLTSAASDDINKDLQSIICNIDSISMVLKNVGKDIVGNTNITPSLLDYLLAQLISVLDSFSSSTDIFIGSQLLSYKLLTLQQDPVFKDRIYALMEGLPPKPFNRFHMTFYVS